MGFADAYLRKAGLREPLIDTEPHSGLQVIVIIPAYKESGLERCLDSLFSCRVEGGLEAGSHAMPEAGTADGFPSSIRAEVIILVNAPAHASAGILESNHRIYGRARDWIREHQNPFIGFHLLLDHSFGPKEAGVGMARKILMDEAVRRFDRIGRPRGIIASMDADAVVEPGYLQALVNHFRSRPVDGCSIYFEHPLSGEEFSPGVYTAITRYELHLRYYLQSTRFTGYPRAFHTVGSCMAVVAEAYCREGGMNRRQAGEDFYFIQKIAQPGNFSECNDTCVIPSPRPSDRVPFGTGAAVSLQLQTTDGLLTYAPESFRMLAGLFEGIEFFYTGVCLDHFMKSRPGVLIEFLDQQDFGKALVEIRRNSASPGTFRNRFWRWFNMFRIMKFLHFARQNGYPDIPVERAAREFLWQSSAWIYGENGEEQFPDLSLEELLRIYRRIDRGGP